MRCIDAGFRHWYKGNDIYFTSSEIEKNAVKEVGEDRLKKYYFEVKD